MHDQHPTAPIPPAASGVPDEALGQMSAEQLALIRLLAVAHEHRLEPIAMVQALADDSPAARQPPLRQLAASLSVGIPLIDALEQTPHMLDRSTVVALRLASQTGTLPAMYRAILRSSELRPASPPVGLYSRGAVLITVGLGLLVLTLVIGFEVAFIFPVLEELAAEMVTTDMGPVVPAAMQFFMRHSGWWPLLSLAAAAWIVYSFMTAVTGRWPSGLPGVARRHGDSVDLLSLLAIVIGAGRPVASGLATLARFHHVPATRQRLLAACQAIERGSDPWRSLADERLLSRRESQALASASSEATQTWLLGWLATSRRDRQLSKSHLTGQLLPLAVILAFAAVVAVLTIGTFQMLINLVQALA